MRRESSFFDISETLKDVEIIGQVKFNDATQFYNVFYTNTIFEDDHNRILAKFGINALDIRYVFEAKGTITDANNAVCLH